MVCAMNKIDNVRQLYTVSRRKKEKKIKREKVIYSTNATNCVLVISNLKSLQCLDVLLLVGGLIACQRKLLRREKCYSFWGGRHGQRQRQWPRKKKDQEKLQSQKKCGSISQVM